MHQALEGPDSLLFSCLCWPEGWERLRWWVQPLCMTQQYCLSFMAAWFSSTGISHHNLFPHIPSGCLPTVNIRPSPGIAPQSLPSSSQPLCLLGDLHPCLGYVWLQQGLSVWFSFHLGCCQSAASLLASNVSPLTQIIAPMWEFDPCFSSPTHQVQVQSY